MLLCVSFYGGINKRDEDNDFNEIIGLQNTHGTANNELKEGYTPTRDLFCLWQLCIAVHAATHNCKTQLNIAHGRHQDQDKQCMGRWGPSCVLHLPDLIIYNMHRIILEQEACMNAVPTAADNMT